MQAHHTGVTARSLPIWWRTSSHSFLVFCRTWKTSTSRQSISLLIQGDHETRIESKIARTSGFLNKDLCSKNCSKNYQTRSQRACRHVNATYKRMSISFCIDICEILTRNKSIFISIVSRCAVYELILDHRREYGDLQLAIRNSEKSNLKPPISLQTMNCIANIQLRFFVSGMPKLCETILSWNQCSERLFLTHEASVHTLKCTCCINVRTGRWAIAEMLLKG